MKENVSGCFFSEHSVELFRTLHNHYFHISFTFCTCNSVYVLHTNIIINTFSHIYAFSAVYGHQFRSLMALLLESTVSLDNAAPLIYPQ